MYFGVKNRIVLLHVFCLHFGIIKIIAIIQIANIRKSYHFDSLVY